MGYRCAPQLLGLVRGEPKPGQRHRANGKAILGEAGKERHSASETLDRTRSADNIYELHESGFACWDAMCAEADAYRVPTKLRNGQMAERGLRHDAVIGYALIINPPHDMSAEWTDEQYIQFYHDSFEVLGEINPDLFRQENLRMTAQHKDEGRMAQPGAYGQHIHIFGTAKGRDGRYCGNKIDARLLIAINESYPRMMREKGWDLDDLDTTDWDRMKTDEAYRQQRYERKKSGKSVNAYRSKALTEAIDNTIKLGEEMTALKDEYETQIEGVDEYVRNTKSNADTEAKRIIDDAKKKTDNADAQAKKTLADAKRRAEQIVNQAIADAQRKLDDADDEIDSKYDELNAEHQRREDQWDSQMRALEADRDKVKLILEQAQQLPVNDDIQDESLSKFAKRYTRKVRANNETGYEVHNCYDDWIAAQKERRELNRRTRALADRLEDNLGTINFNRQFDN